MTTDYVVVQAGEAHLLTQRVKDYLVQGWYPLGGVSVDRNGYLLQAMGRGR